MKILNLLKNELKNNQVFIKNRNSLKAHLYVRFNCLHFSDKY